MQEKEIELRDLTSLIDDQKAHSPSNSANDTSELPTTEIYEDTQCPSTRQLNRALARPLFRPFYKLHSRILQHTSITQNMRARLRSFLIAETSKQCILRQTCALACNLVDLYFLHMGQVEVNEFQSLVIGCLILAAKLKEGKFPTISYNIFSREQLLSYQKKIAKRLSFNLLPSTYHDYAEKIVFLWDYHTHKLQAYNLRFADAPTGANIKIRKFYEQLDCIHMVLKSLDYDTQELVLNLFYLHARMLNVYEVPSPNTLSEESFFQAFYPPHDYFQHFYESFLQFYSEEQSFTLNPQIGLYLKYFLGVTPVQKEWTIKGNPEVLENIRIWDKIQTSPKDNYQLAKIVIEKTNLGAPNRR